MSKHTVTALFVAVLALGVAFVGLLLILSSQVSAGDDETQPAAELDPGPALPDAPSSLPAVGSGGLADLGDEAAGPSAALTAETRSDLAPFLTALTVTAVLGLLGLGVVRRWFPAPEAGEAH